MLARAPETERPTRHLLRTRLTWAGLGSPAPGVWVSTHADAGRRGASGCSTRPACSATRRSSSAEHARARRPARDGARRRGTWTRSSSATRSSSPGSAAGRRRDPLAATVELVHAWRRFPWIDPALPTRAAAHAVERGRGGQAVRPPARPLGRRRAGGVARARRRGRREPCFEQVRHRPPAPLAAPRELVVACAPMRSNVNLSTIARTAGLLRRRADDRLRQRAPRPHHRPRRRRRGAARGAQLAAAGAAHAARRRLPARRAGADDELADPAHLRLPAPDGAGDRQRAGRAWPRTSSR